MSLWYLNSHATEDNPIVTHYAYIKGILFHVERAKTRDLRLYSLYTLCGYCYDRVKSERPNRLEVFE